MLHSSKLKIYTGELSLEITAAVRQIKEYFEDNSLEVFSYGKRSIVIKGVYSVSLPSRGSVDGVDIRPKEPVLIRINLKNYPDIAPTILSDRKDFPKQKLSHLYLTQDKDPAALCLVRNNPNDWFADSKLNDLLDTGAQWFYKAGAGLLSVDGGEFDPTRLEGNIIGQHIYDYDMVYQVVVNNQRLIPQFPMALCYAGQLTEGTKSVNYKSIEAVPFLMLSNFRENVKKWYKEQNETHKVKNSPVFSILLWHPDGLVEPDYLTNLPKTYKELKIFFKERGIDLKTVLIALHKEGVLFKRGIPVIYAMKRPLKMIGYNGDYEFFNFVVTAPVSGISDIPNTDIVLMQQHTSPFNAKMANEISGEDRNAKTLYIGAGSLGSKIIMHDARSGNKQLGIVDNDKLLPHNLARHVLSNDEIGFNKAEALIEKIKGFYNTELTPELTAIERSIVFITEKELEGYQLFVDTTANILVRNNMVKRKLPELSKYVKAEVADEGRLGLLYIEGADRNPRMDDLNYLACYLGTKSKRIRKWRKADVQRTQTNLNIGQGCSSATSVMPDDSLSFHASLFSKVLAKAQAVPVQSGKLLVTIVDEKIDGVSISTENYTVGPFDILECQNDSGWQIRLYPDISERLLTQCDEHSPVETGGVLVGVVNYKLKTIYVFDILLAPPDSKGSTVRFQRGVAGLPQAIDQIKTDTGGMIGYVGEWHSHPMNLEQLSGTDRSTIADLKKINALVPIPTCAIIVTKEKVLPFVFD